MNLKKIYYQNKNIIIYFNKNQKNKKFQKLKKMNLKYLENIKFLDYQNFKIKMIPIQDPENDENALLHMTVFSEEKDQEQNNYLCIINFQEEYQKQKNLDDIFADLEFQQIGQQFLEFFSKKQYNFEQDLSNENQVKLKIQTKMVFANKEKKIEFEFIFIKKNLKQKQQSLQNVLYQNNQNIQEKKKFQKQNLEKKSFINIGILEYIIIVIVLALFVQQILSFQQVVQDVKKVQEDIQNLSLEQMKMQELVKNQLQSHFITVSSQIKNFQSKYVEKIESEKKETQIQQYFENKEINLFNIKKWFQLQLDQSYENFEKICQFLVGSRPQLFQVKNKLENVIKLFDDPKKILSLSIMLPQQFDNKYNPKQILKSNTKNITHDEFKNKCANLSNTIILVKVKKIENSDWEVYGGYAPDKTIFDKEGYSCKTDQTEQYNFPFTFDLNQNIKRNLINKDTICYWRSSSEYFDFNSYGLYLNNSNTFYFAKSDYNYESPHQEENQNQKRYQGKQVYDAEIEVIQLF